MSKKGKFFIGLIIFIIGYNIFQYFNLKVKRHLALEQCEQQGGVHGTAPSDIKGILDTSKTFSADRDILQRGRIFINQGLEFVEFTSDRHLDIRWFDQKNKIYFPKANGIQKYKYYRVYVSEIEDPLCEPYFYYLKEAEPMLIKEGQCVGVIGFDDPGLLKSEYELRTTREEMDDWAEITWNRTQLIKRNTNEILVSHNLFYECLTGSYEVGGGRAKHVRLVEELLALQIIRHLMIFMALFFV